MKKLIGNAILPAMLVAACGATAQIGDFGGNAWGCGASWFLVGASAGMLLTGVMAPVGAVAGIKIGRAHV